MCHKQSITSAYGVDIPRIIYGTAWKKEQTAVLVEHAIEQGFRAIDTACQSKHYNEAGVGQAVSICVNRGLDRADLYLQSKFTPLDGQDPMQLPYDPKANLSAQVAQSFQTSLRNLQTTYLDCLVLHSPLANKQQLHEVWQAMELIYDNGGVKQLEISNCYDSKQLQLLYSNATIKPAIIQNRFYARTGYDKSIRAFCKQQQIIYQSFWTLKGNPDVLAHDIFSKLAIKYQKSVAQLFFRYLTQIDIIPLTGTTSKTHMREDLSIFDFELTADDCEAIEQIIYQ